MTRRQVPLCTDTAAHASTPASWPPPPTRKNSASRTTALRMSTGRLPRLRLPVPIPALPSPHLPLPSRSSASNNQRQAHPKPAQDSKSDRQAAVARHSSRSPWTRVGAHWSKFGAEKDNLFLPRVVSLLFLVPLTRRSEVLVGRGWDSQARRAKAPAVSRAGAVEAVPLFEGLGTRSRTEAWIQR